MVILRRLLTKYPKEDYLHSCKVNDNIINWICDCLKARKYRVM